jgi:hypothetical protein
MSDFLEVDLEIRCWQSRNPSSVLLRNNVLCNSVHKRHVAVVNGAVHR